MMFKFFFFGSIKVLLPIKKKKNFFFYHVPFCGCFGFNVLVYFPHLQLDVTSAQLLVTDNDFRDKAFRNQLSETVQSLLSLKVIPIFNENDAVSTRRAPYEVCYHF